MLVNCVVITFELIWSPVARVSPFTCALGRNALDERYCFVRRYGYRLMRQHRPIVCPLQRHRHDTAQRSYNH